MEPVSERLRVVLDGRDLADTVRGYRVLETAGAPVYYFPPADVRMDQLVASPHESYCEWKGSASYLTYLSDARRIENIGWRYLTPNSGFEAIAGYVAFYAGRVDEAWFGDELATPQPGRFYGGWVTSRIVGPFKGGPGSVGW